MGPDIQIDSVVLACATAIEVKARALTPADAEVCLEPFHVGLFPFGEPSAFCGWIREAAKTRSGEAG
jgi:hypothetical protein